MKNILYLTDFIEGKSVVASVRYTGLMPYLNKSYNIVVVNDKKYGDEKSKICKENYKFDTIRSAYNKGWTSVKENKVSHKEKILRKNKFIMSLWRNITHSELLFNFRNRNLYKLLLDYMKKNKVDVIFATVPDFYTLYIAKYIKKNFPHIPLVVEVRDILNCNIGNCNPKFARKKAEQILINNADGIITLTQGIYDYYHKLYSKNDIIIIKNGYNDEDFQKLECEKCDLAQKKQLNIAHIGSIYSGRNVKDFIKALIKISEALSIDIMFNIVGFLDGEAIEDIAQLENSLKKSRVKISITGTIEHKEAINYLKKADISVILTHKHGSDYAIPGKTFEYIGSCTPIIAVSEDKPLIELIDGKYGECAKHNENDILEKLFKIINSKYDFSHRTKFSRKIQSDKIVDFTNKTIVKISKTRGSDYGENQQ